MTDTRPFDPALFSDAAIDADTAKLNTQIELLPVNSNGGSSAPRQCGLHAGAAKGPFPLRYVGPGANPDDRW